MCTAHRRPRARRHDREAGGFQRPEHHAVAPRVVDRVQPNVGLVEGAEVRERDRLTKRRAPHGERHQPGIGQAVGEDVGTGARRIQVRDALRAHRPMDEGQVGPVLSERSRAGAAAVRRRGTRQATSLRHRDTLGVMSSPTSWSAGRYDAIGDQIATIATEVVSAADRRVPLSDAAVADLACGTGSAALAASAAGARVTGVDITPELIALAVDKAEAAGIAVNWMTADAADTGLPSGSFDAVVSNMGDHLRRAHPAGCRDRAAAQAGRCPGFLVVGARSGHPLLPARS